jgi:hypothetical protein
MTRSSAVVADHAGLENVTMNISHKLITLGLAFSLLGSTWRVRKADAAFRNGGLSCGKRTVASHFPTANAFGATHYARPPSANADKDGWPADMP